MLRWIGVWMGLCRPAPVVQPRVIDLRACDAGRTVPTVCPWQDVRR